MKVTGKLATLVALGYLFISFACAQTDSVTLTINPAYNVMNTGTAIPIDFSGLGFETASVPFGANGLGTGAYFFSPSSTSVTAFQNLGIHNLRIGGSSVDGCSRITPSNADISNLFGFAAAANLKVIYSLPLLNNWSCNSTTLASDDGTVANTIMANYSANLHSFSLGNEVDFHSYHTYCDTYSANCTCINGSGCSISGTGNLHTNDPNIFETFNPCSNSSGSRCTFISGESYEPGSAFSSHFTDWLSFASTITGAVTSGTPVFSGPDSGDYTGNTQFTGTVAPCNNHSFTNATWTQMLSTCEGLLDATNFSLPTQHLYVGGSLGGVTYQQAIDNMLSALWVTGTSVGTEPYGSGTYSPYSFMKGQVPPGTRLTESNDYLGGMSQASNAFASALWALEYMHWWAANGAAGVNFHNNQWIYTDTIVPSNAVYGAPGMCSPAPCLSTYEVNPKGYGIKAFDLGGHGYSVPVSPNPTSHNGHIDAYAVGNGQDLYVTIINKYNSVTNNAATANVTINLTSGSGNALPFASASVASMTLTDVTGGGAGNVATADWTSTTLGGANITDSKPWYGLWNNSMSSYMGGGYSVTVQAGTATVLRFHASSNYTDSIQVNQNGALEMAAVDGSGNVYHNWQKSSTEPSSTTSDWSASGMTGWTPLPRVTATGNPVEIKNQNNTLEIFVPTSGNVYHVWQLTPGGAWSNWTDMGNSSNGMTDLQVGHNGDGGLTVFGLFAGNIYYSTQNAPGTGWSVWAPLGSPATSGLQAGYAVAQNLNGRLEVFAADGSGNPQIWHIWQTNGGTFGNTWKPLNTSGAYVSDPQLAVARNLSGDLEVFGIGTDGYLWHSAQAAPSGAWNTWSELENGTQKVVQHGFAVGQNDSGDLVVFGVAGSGSNAMVYYNSQSSPGGSYASTWTPMPMGLGNYPLNGQLEAGSTADGRIQIFCVGYNGSTDDVFTNWQTTSGGSGSWNGWSDFGTGSSGLAF